MVAAVLQASEDRVVVTHGTDTLIESAQYLAQSGAGASKVVAFTGAMKPERFKDSDAAFNLGAAVAATATLPHGSVVVAMGGAVIDATKCARDKTSGRFVEDVAS